MRDHETAATGIEASLTGHLVFSTLHTNSAPETIVRLLDMDIDPFNFADALLGILAQRLVRTLCKECKEEYAPTQEEFAELMESYGLDHWDRLGIRYSGSFRLYKPKGCPSAGHGVPRPHGPHELLVGHRRHQALDPAPPPWRAAQAGHQGRHDHPAPGRIEKVIQGLDRLQAMSRGLHEVGWQPGGSAACSPDNGVVAQAVPPETREPRTPMAPRGEW